MKRSYSALSGLLLVICVFGIAVRCGRDQLAGGASETENVAGLILTPAGVPAAHTRIMLLPAGSSPLASASSAAGYCDTTDCRGRYRFLHVDTGTYSLSGVQMQNGQRFLQQGIVVANGIDSVPVGADTLKTPGRIIISLPTGMRLAGGYLYLPGTTVYARIDSADVATGTVEIDSVPAASYTGVWYAPPGPFSTNGTASAGVTVVAGAVDTVAAQPYSAKVVITTSATGADVATDLFAVPVLIRLTSSNFNFSQVPGNGRGVCFSNASGARLPFEVERWDSGDGLAEVWVAVDTIHGNNASQYFRFFWGGSSSDSGSSAAVFAVSQGWAGAWHLEESAPDTTTPLLYKNAVEAANYGDDFVTSTTKTGIIGLGQTFSSGDRIQVTNATSRLKPAQVTLSAWVRLYRTDSLSSDVASMGDNYILRIDKVNNSPKFVLYNLADTLEIVCQDSAMSMADSSWHHLAGTFDGQNVCLYVDGTLRKSVAYAGAIQYNLGPDFMIGRHGDNKKYFNFIGSLDEVECSSVARSAPWIKFAYENQKAGSAVVAIVK